ncbi:hypothetical protein KH5H1_23230 [Corallococcus caeni]|uniref:Uncharacterized protein n=1 Tax=Corallococcus caeni TaxID=3082388 RepID=A0ABQ6QSM3_9BACT|nr:hypothetical protein KH5H1_23230 [Corallococcus sp. KH5-1]GMU06990.1 hypothetical protein ASNO1_32430 [Corallococcus sp. NO1]
MHPGGLLRLDERPFKEREEGLTLTGMQRVLAQFEDRAAGGRGRHAAFRGAGAEAILGRELVGS